MKKIRYAQQVEGLSFPFFGEVDNPSMLKNEWSKDNTLLMNERCFVADGQSFFSFIRPSAEGTFHKDNCRHLPRFPELTSSSQESRMKRCLQVEALFLSYQQRIFPFLHPLLHRRKKKVTSLFLMVLFQLVGRHRRRMKRYAQPMREPSKRDFSR